MAQVPRLKEVCGALGVGIAAFFVVFLTGVELGMLVACLDW